MAKIDKNVNNSNNNDSNTSKKNNNENIKLNKNNKINDKDLKRSKKNLFLEPTMTLDDWPIVKGYNFSNEFNLKKFIDSLYNTGFQATQINGAISILKEMKKENTTIFFGFTSNMVSCGIRDIITYLVKNKHLHVLVTTAGGVEEDIIKTIKPFVIGSYNTPGSYLRDKGINRTGNIFIPNDRYVYFERFMNKFLERLYNIQKKENKIFNSKEFCYEIGKELELQNIEKKEESIYYWAYKNNIPVFCPGLTDGSIGDMIFFFKSNYPDFKIDITDDIVDITKLALNSDKTGIIALGGSLPKHHIANANMFKEGADYAIYMTTAQEYEGSNAGANIEEAKSWGKIKEKAKTVKVIGDCSITFPLLIAGFLYT